MDVVRQALRPIRRARRGVFRALARTGRRLVRAAAVARKRFWLEPLRRMRRRRPRERLALVWARVRSGWASFDPFYGPPGEQRECPACADTRLVHLDVLWQVRRHTPRFVGFMTGCRTCGLMFSNPLPTRAELEAYYNTESDYAERRWNRPSGGATPRGGTEGRESSLDDAPGEERAARPSTGGAAGPVATADAKLRALFVSVRETLDITSPPPGARVLDYGCGPGRMLDRFASLGWSTAGIEPAVKTAFTRHEELTAPPAEPTFHLVILHHVLEHLANPLEVLRAISASMVEGGLLFVSVPRFDAAAEHGDLRYTLDSHGHVMAYTEASMTTLLAMAGLHAVRPANDAELDRLLTRGEPRRLRVFGVKRAAPPPRPRAPLAQAERTLAAWRARFDPGRGRLARLAPVRMRAAALQQAKTREILVHRSAKLAARRPRATRA